MVCFPGSVLGSRDFCAESCEPDSLGSSSNCFATSGSEVRARLLTCHPSERGAACPAGLVCYPSDLARDEGRCLPPCDGDERCQGPLTTCDKVKAPCPQTAAGKDMVCVAGWQLRGEDFCAEKCDPEEPAEDPEHFVCSSAGAKLKVCRPSMDDCPLGLECYRTDLAKDEGVCLAMHVCSSDPDCGDYRRCAGTLVQGLLQSVPIAADHLNCMQPTCKTEGTQCSESETCLAEHYSSEQIADICAPKCDAEWNCPPNFGCLYKTAGPGSPKACLPGTPGARCARSLDCAFGDCLDVGVEFKVCSMPCASDAECQRLDFGADRFVCAEITPGQRRCVTPRPFNGANCEVTEHCPEGQRCYQYSLYESPPSHGECRVPCDEDNPCPARGGLPHTCLGQGEGGCYPGYFSAPCEDVSQCMGGLGCLDAPADAIGPDGEGARVCSLACDTDQDCLQDSWIGVTGFCAGGICRMHGSTGAPCLADEECFSRSCRITAGSSRGSCAALAR
jgi:hypothetical protein